MRHKFYKSNIYIFAILFFIAIIIFLAAKYNPKKNNEELINFDIQTKDQMSAESFIITNTDSDIYKEHKKNFSKKYNQNIPKRQLFEEYLSVIGVNGILDFLEEKRNKFLNISLFLFI